jgi:5-methylcytosine-specific restriction endonuclease McrA
MVRHIPWKADDVLRVGKALAYVILCEETRGEKKLAERVRQLFPEVLVQVRGVRHELDDYIREKYGQPATNRKIRQRADKCERGEHDVQYWQEYPPRWIQSGDDTYEKVKQVYGQILRGAQPLSNPEPFPASPSLERRAFTDEQLVRALHAHNFQCRYCGTRLMTSHNPAWGVTRPVADHFVPYSVSGSSADWNCVPACEPCNKAKGATMPDEFIRQQLNAGHKTSGRKI